MSEMTSDFLCSVCKSNLTSTAFGQWKAWLNHKRLDTAFSERPWLEQMPDGPNYGGHLPLVAMGL